MLTIGTALLHIGAAVLGGVSSALAVELWRDRNKPPARPAVPSTAGAAPRGRRSLAGGPRTGGVDAFVAVRRVVEAVPFYGPPAATALDVARESAVVHRPQKARNKPPSRAPGRPGALKEGSAAPPKQATTEVGKPGGNEAAPKAGEEKPRANEAGPGPGENRLAPNEADSKSGEPKAGEQRAGKPNKPQGESEKNQGREEKAENHTMIMSDKGSAKTVTEPPRELSTIVAGLAAADEEVGAAMAPQPPPVDYFVPGPRRIPVISKERYRDWRARYDEYQRELAAYNSARAFDKQIERQKKEIRENIRRAKSNNEVTALKGQLRQVESMGRLSRRPRIFMNIDRDARLGALIRGVMSGQRPQVNDNKAFDALIQGFLALAHGKTQAAPAEPFVFPGQTPAAPMAAPPVTTPGFDPAAPFTMPPGPAAMPAPMAPAAVAPVPAQAAPVQVPAAAQAPFMAPAPAVPVGPAPMMPVAPVPATPYALPPDQPYAAQPSAPNMPPAQAWRDDTEAMDPRLAPMDESYGGLQALADDGFGVIELEGTCQCGGTCGKCSPDPGVGCASCAIGDVDDDDEIEASAGPQDIGEDGLEGFEDGLEGTGFGDDLDGGGFGDELEGEDDDDELEGFEGELEGGFGDELEGMDDDELEGFEDELEGSEFGDELEGDDFDDEDE